MVKERTKRLAHTAIQSIVNRVPWGAREAILEACFKKYGLEEISARLFPKLGIAEVGVWGNLGLIRSAWNDRQILATYARTGAAEGGIVKEIQDYFGEGGGTYIDVGANIGLTLIPIARNTQIRCIAFEPEPGNFRFLKLNVEANVDGQAVEFHQKAAFHTHSVLSLAIADGNLGDHRITMDGVAGRHTVDVSAVPLDDVLDRIDGKLAVKVDTQGAEPSVILGGRNVLSRAGLLAMEFCPFLIRQLGGNPDVVIDLLETFDRVALIEAGSDDSLQYGTPASAQTRLRKKVKDARDTDGDYFDIVARRGS